MAEKKVVSVRLDVALLARVDAAAGSRTAFIERALEAALSDDTHGSEPRGASMGHSDAGHHASAAGAASPRGASRPAASPRASAPRPALPPGVVRGSDVDHRPRWLVLGERSLNGHRPGCGCIRCDDVRMGRRPYVPEDAA
jgi:hypothetical protein